MPKIIYITATQAQHNFTPVLKAMAEGNTVVFTKYGSELGRFIPSSDAKTKMVDDQAFQHQVEDLIKRLAKPFTTYNGKAVRDISHYLRKQRDAA